MGKTKVFKVEFGGVLTLPVLGVPRSSALSGARRVVALKIGVRVLL